jgi:CheY-like chemotaxis protein
MDRRRQSRGGRRAGDREGFAPLVMLVGDEPSVMDRSEAILAKLRFAVTTSPNVDHALRVFPQLKPDLVVVSEGDSARVRGSAPPNVPIVVMDGRLQADSDALIEAIRRALRPKPADS